MTSIAYSSPYVPPEWIAAHGFRPLWLKPGGRGAKPLVAARRGVCPYAGALMDDVLSGLEASALVLTTVCDQMRYGAAFLERHAAMPLFLMNVPSTWQTPAAMQIYRGEIERLGHFLIGLGAAAPSDQSLAAVMREYDEARAVLRKAENDMPARQFVEASAELRGGVLQLQTAVPVGHEAAPFRGIPLALIGGPLREEDYSFYDLVQQAGGQIVLDGGESGSRCFPAGFDRKEMAHNPRQALLDAYFGRRPDIFCRPNTEFYEWLQRELAARPVRGVLLWRFLWCDLWHAESKRMKERFGLPLLEIDAGQSDDSGFARTLGRLEAFLETLK